jgi:hypothetical protein
VVLKNYDESEKVYVEIMANRSKYRIEGEIIRGAISFLMCGKFTLTKSDFAG